MRSNDHSSGNRKTGEIRCALFCAVSVVLLLGMFSPPAASGSWLIDPESFHASAHGRMSCQDCHGDILKKPLHPNPLDIRKGSWEFFSPEQCFSCHDDVKENLLKNLHGSKPIGDPEMYSVCLDCHDPHAQPLLRDESVSFDPILPRQRQCGACHKDREALPALSAEDQDCMVCHSAPKAEDAKAAERIQGVCLHCHAEGPGASPNRTREKIPLLRLQEYQKTPHAGMGCTICHPDSTGFDHSNQESGSCWRCHEPHAEKAAHDAHIGVSCESCHLKGVKAVKEPEGIFWMREEQPGGVSRLHEMSWQKGGEEGCRRCHAAGNEVGAAAMVLPAKGLLCMPCHTATFSVGDTVTIAGLVVFLAGMGLFLAPALSGGRRGTGSGASHSARESSALSVFFLDVLLQRRLFRRSRVRWVIHALIFFPFLFRFLWGLAALFGSMWGGVPDWIWEMIDKNQPMTAFLFDLSGVMLLLGVALAFARGAKASRLPGEPPQDRIGLGLIAAIVLVGFVLEGWRIAMTGWPDGSQYAFLGYWLSRLFNAGSPAVTSVYGYIWYAHAVLTGGLFAYLPFSRLLHVIMAPLVLLMNRREE
jgi:nitrate reductase gamma subunit